MTGRIEIPDGMTPRWFISQKITTIRNSVGALAIHMSEHEYSWLHHDIKTLIEIRDEINSIISRAT